MSDAQPTPHTPDGTALRLDEGERRARRARLQAAGRSLMDETVPSPCVSVCRIADGLCTGCHRTIGEIVDWSLLEAREKRSVLAALPARAERPA
jgi:hypothetical protein